MKNLIIIKSLFLAIIITFASCSDGLEGDIPDCLEDEFKQLKNNACDSGATLKLFQFQGENAYVFDAGLCGNDGSSDVYNENCELLGTLGTIAGIVLINDVNFSENATEQVILWSN